MQNKISEESKVVEHESVPVIGAKSKFSIGKIARFCKSGRFAERIGAGAPIYIAAVLEYLTSEIVELAEHQLKAEINKKGNKKKQRIAPRHVMLAIQNDPELAQLFKNSSFCGAGTVPTVNKVAENSKKGKKLVDTDSEDEEDF